MLRTPAQLYARDIVSTLNRSSRHSIAFSLKGNNSTASRIRAVHLSGPNLDDISESSLSFIIDNAGLYGRVYRHNNLHISLFPDGILSITQSNPIMDTPASFILAGIRDEFWQKMLDIRGFNPPCLRLSMRKEAFFDIFGRVSDIAHTYTCQELEYNFSDFSLILTGSSTYGPMESSDIDYIAAHKGLAYDDYFMDTFMKNLRSAAHICGLHLHNLVYVGSTSNRSINLDSFSAKGFNILRNSLTVRNNTVNLHLLHNVGNSEIFGQYFSMAEKLFFESWLPILRKAAEIAFPDRLKKHNTSDINSFSRLSVIQIFQFIVCTILAHKIPIIPNMTLPDYISIFENRGIISCNEARYALEAYNFYTSLRESSSQNDSSSNTILEELGVATESDLWHLIVAHDKAIDQLLFRFSGRLGITPFIINGINWATNTSLYLRNSLIGHTDRPRAVMIHE